MHRLQVRGETPKLLQCTLQSGTEPRYAQNIKAHLLFCPFLADKTAGLLTGLQCTISLDM